MGRMGVPLIWGAGEGLVIPADQVTALLRQVGDEWRRSAQGPDAGLDPTTAVALADVLRDLADQIDVECIGFASFGSQF